MTAPQLAVRLALLASLAAAEGHAQGGKLLTLRGRVLHEDGPPVARTRVAVRGAGGAAVWTDGAGQFQLELRLPDPRRRRSGTVEAEVYARKPGWRLALAGGAPALAIRLERQGDGCRVTASDERIREALASCFQPGGPPAALGQVSFLGRPWLTLHGVVRDAERRPVRGAAIQVRAGGAALATATTTAAGEFAASFEPAAGHTRFEVGATHPDYVFDPPLLTVARRQVDRLGPVAFRARPRVATPPDSLRATAPTRPAAGAPAPVPRASREAAHASPAPPGPPRPRATPDEPPVPPFAGPAAGAGAGCRCRVRGILELVALDVVSPPPRIEVRLAPGGARRDTVSFFMGAPRAFDLQDVPCGRYAVRARNLGPERWTIVNPRGIPEVHCEDGSVSELRLLLERR